MRPPIRGRLITSSFVDDVLPSLPIFVAPPVPVRRQMERCAEHIGEHLGPSASARTVADVAILPLLTLLGLTARTREDAPACCRVHTASAGNPGPVVIVTPFGDSLDRAWRSTVHGAIANDGAWCICCNGQSLRVIDARRTWSRAFVEFDLAATLDDEAGQALLWSFLRGEAMTALRPAVEDAAQRSAQHGVEVCQALGRGVLDALTLLLGALRRRPQNEAVVFEYALTVLYRVLFLLFAEARGLVPLWHPVYRDRYSLHTIVSHLLAGASCRGLWQTLHAISRLAHSGCAVGELRVTAFNGRLFSPVGAPAIEKPVRDEVMKQAIVAVSSTPGGTGRPRLRVSYRDLDVEQLGAVYEQVLDYEPGPPGTATLIRTRDARKSSGAFYTPRALTASLVRWTLTPLVEGKSADEILRLRIVDPAMGSGAFLVAACRYLASAVEDALVRDGRWHAGDVTVMDRALLRRDIASRCLYGVDLNPMAVQLARLSLWLTTMAADRPLSFLDHHLLAGDSLIGAAAHDVQRQPAGLSTSARRHQELPLFETTGLDDSLAAAARERARIAIEPDDSASIVHRKERTLAFLAAAETPANRWRRILDAWCAAWFWDEGPPPDRAIFGEMVQHLLRDRSSLPTRVVQPLLARAAGIATRRRFFHWTFSFPEVFAAGGFDAVIGNPPWDMLRGDAGAVGRRDERRQQARSEIDFFHSSGIYVAETRAHANRYQFFVERALQLLRHGGRLGLVLPTGVFSDSGSAGLRRHLFERASVDAITGMENRHGIFPIHRSVRFSLMTASAGARTDAIACRFGLTRVDELEAPAHTLTISRRLLTRLSGSDDLGIPELSSERHFQILEHISAGSPWLADAAGWNARFGRELNATDDRHAFRSRSRSANGRPVVEGKQLEPFRVDVGRSEFALPPDAAAARRVPARTRLGYREVASATNRLTLIAALLPEDVVTTHTVFCLKTPLPLAHQRVLCAVLNSFVANYLIRLRVHTHVTASLVARLPAPVVSPAHPTFARLDALTHTLSKTVRAELSPDYSELQALVAHAYRLTAADFAHILETFPLIPASVREAALNYFIRIDRSR